MSACGDSNDAASKNSSCAEERQPLNMMLSVFPSTIHAKADNTISIRAVAAVAPDTAQKELLLVGFPVCTQRASLFRKLTFRSSLELFNQRHRVSKFIGKNLPHKPGRAIIVHIDDVDSVLQILWFIISLDATELVGIFVEGVKVPGTGSD